MESITLDEIREKAIEIIKENPKGIRQHQLIWELNNALHERFANDSKTTDPKIKIRNAVWNLETKTSEVIKQQLGPREVIFLPTEPVSYDARSYIKEFVDSTIAGVNEHILTSNYDHYLPKALAQDKMVYIWFLITELENAIRNNGKAIDRLYDFSPEELGTLDFSQIETIFELRQAINSIKKARELTSKRKEE